MRVRGEIVFPNNLRELRLRKQLTQAQLGHLMDPPLGESTISKIEAGERRPTNLQLANLAILLGCSPEAIPLVAARDPSSGVRRWQNAQEEALLFSIESGAAAVAYILAQLRKKSGKTMQQVADAIGMTLSVYHRLEMASRGIQSSEIEALAKFYDLQPARLIAMFERRTQDNRAQLERGVPPEQLLPRTPRSLLKDEARWGRLGALERYAMRRSIRLAAPAPRPTVLPVYGSVVSDADGARRFVIDHQTMVEQIAAGELLAAAPEAFLVRNFSPRLGFLLRPGTLAYVDPQTPVAMGDIAFVVRHDRTADAAVVIGDGLSPLKLKMYSPEEELAIDDRQVASVLRIRMLLLP